MILSLFINLGILGFFKYYNFFIDSFLDFANIFNVSLNVYTLNIILPVGISFYTFQTLSYTIDIYYGKLKPTRNVVSFFTFVAFFPQLVAGPIERAGRLLPQFMEKKKFSYNNSVAGLRLILWGLFKKIVIADNLGLLVDVIFDPASEFTGISVFMGGVLFAFQVYCDFSGYSDIAIGISKMLGFELMINFKTPFFSASFSELWKRWHISLSTWFRDYVYIPLGGSKKSQFRVDLNIFITFFLSGLWHGAHISFVLWGSLHGVVLIIEKYLKLKLKPGIAIPFVFFIFCLLLLPFRAVDMSHLYDLLYRLSVFNFSFQEIWQSSNALLSVKKSVTLLAVIFIFMIAEYNIGLSDFNSWIGKLKNQYRISTYVVLIVTIALLGNFDVKPYFIYFQF
ncbi:MAG: MBOAT family O-acyltransferase [Bacteroidales bacterium]